MGLLSFTRKADYGMGMLSVLAELGKREVVNLSTLVEKRNIPRAFGAQIGRKLVDAGIIGSLEGRGGGYFLRTSPEKINLKTVLEAIDGEVAIVECVLHGHGCLLEKKCSQSGFMKKLNKELGELLEQYSVYDLVDKK